jgi:predicted glycogen debranching enzyme
VATGGIYHHQGEWSHNLPHPVEQSRGQADSGDAFSPGWFEIPLAKGNEAAIAVSAEQDFDLGSITFPQPPKAEPAAFAVQLHRAAQAFLSRRGKSETVIAGYPWFLDWGRDTLICARGLLAAGLAEEVRELLLTFARFEQAGTLPNTIHGDNVSNRDTTDAPLWFSLGCEELAAAERAKARQKSKAALRSFYHDQVDDAGRTIAEVLISIAEGFLRGTPNNIRVDQDSALVWSPSHFTWMDTNHPAGTPREGYPVEIQVLWIRLLRQLARLEMPRAGKSYAELAALAETSFHRFYWLDKPGWFADGLLMKNAGPAHAAQPDQALRSNGLFAVSLGLVTGERAQRCVEAARRHLVIPGALRSLAPLPVTPPLPIHGKDGRLLNNPAEPYWGKYEGDEDTRRKPAYHNGAAWTWTLPVFCEALMRAWDFAPAAVAAARAYLGSMAQIMGENCLGQIPELLDGDVPHQQRGCDAQAWGVTEALRVWELIKSAARKPPDAAKTASAQSAPARK